MKKLTKDQKGFTIIEVLIVLAIAGLIMLIVFLAVPALQRNQRNNARNAEASRLSALANECLSNRNGQPDACQDDASLGVNAAEFRELTSRTYANSATAAATTAYDTTTEVILQFNRSCGPNGDVDANGTTRQYVVLYRLEPSISKCISS